MKNDEDQNNQQEQPSREQPGQERQQDRTPDYRRLIDTERKSNDPDRRPFETKDIRGPGEEK